MHNEYWIRKDSSSIDGVFYAWNDKGRDKSIDCIKAIDKAAYKKAIDIIRLEREYSIADSVNSTFERLTKGLYDLGEL